MILFASILPQLTLWVVRVRALVSIIWTVKVSVSLI